MKKQVATNNMAEISLAFPQFHYIKSDEELLLCCQKASQKSFVVLDTEFVRIRTFYPQLGLIQLYDGEQLSLIDPLTIQNFTPFIELLSNKKVLKVLHACSEDLDVFLHFFKQLPESMLDTQIMAQFLNLGSCLGLATLLKTFFHIEMDKGPSRTNWLIRPLSQVQLNYAAADVGYLYPLYQVLAQKLVETPWAEAAKADCARLVNKYRVEKDSNKAYLKIPHHWNLKGIELARLQALAKWRYEEAIKRDLALNFVVKGNHLYSVAKENPKHTSKLLELGLTEMEVRIHGKKIIRILERANKIPAEEWPEPMELLNKMPEYRKTLKLLQRKLAEVAPAKLPIEVIAAKKQLEELMRWVWIKKEQGSKLPVLLQDWRKPYGEQLLVSLKEIMASVDNKGNEPS